MALALDSRLPRLAEVAAAADRGEADRLRKASALLAREDGVETVREVLRLLHLFVGFPKAVQAVAELDGLLRGSEPPAPADAPDGVRGRALFERLYGAEAGPVLGRLEARDPVLTGWILDHAYGRVMSREILSIEEIERLAVLALAASGCWKQWESHARNVLRLGVDRDVLATDLEAADWLDAAATARARAGIETLQG